MPDEEKDGTATLDVDADSAKDDAGAEEGSEVPGDVDYEAFYQQNKDRIGALDKMESDLKTREGRVLKGEDVLERIESLAQTFNKARDTDRVQVSELLKEALGAANPSAREEVGKSIDETNSRFAQKSQSQIEADEERQLIAANLMKKADAAGVDINTGDFLEWRKKWTAEAKTQAERGEFSSVPYLRMDSEFRDMLDAAKDARVAEAAKAEADKAKEEQDRQSADDYDLSTGGGGGANGFQSKMEGMTPTQKIQYELEKQEKAAGRS